MKNSGRALILLLLIFSQSCNDQKSKIKEGGENKLSQREKIRLKQYLVQGRKLYLANCSNCHQKDGTGLGRLIPPLKDADFLKGNVNETICIIKYGLSGEITVNNISYNQPMPANERLRDIEIAEIVTYIYNTWGSKKEIISIQEVSKVLKECKESSQQE